MREGKEGNVTIAPVQDAVDGQYRIGLWVRDSTAGIGTVTYYDENNQAFASLGHAIADADTNTNLLLKEGEIVPAEIVGVQKGASCWAHWLQIPALWERYRATQNMGWMAKAIRRWGQEHIRLGSR